MIEIKKFNIAYLEKLASFYVKCYQETYKNLLPKEYLDSKDYQSAYNTFSKPENQNLLILLNGSEIIGFCGYGKGRDNKNYNEIYGLYIDSHFQDNGLGTALLKKAIAEINNKDIYLFVLEKNINAINFYLKNGFTKTNLIKKYANTNCICLKKTI